jgi:hypothetical protein
MFDIRDSATYWLIRKEGMREGILEAAKESLLRLGRKRLGPPDLAIAAKIRAIADLDKLHELLDRLLDVSSWEELLTED